MNLVILIHGHLFNSLDIFLGGLFCFVDFVVVFTNQARSHLGLQRVQQSQWVPQVYGSDLPIVDPSLFPRAKLVPQESEGCEREAREHVMRWWRLPNINPPLSTATHCTLPPCHAAHSLMMVTTTPRATHLLRA